MKTAISIPDDVFVSADRLAKRLQMSRSELYACAVKEYIAEFHHAGVKEKLDQIYASEKAPIDSAVLVAQAISIFREEW